MNNRKLASAAAVLLVGGAALLWLAETRSNMVASGSRITVVGNLPPRDVAEIRRLVRRQLWHGVLPQFSWSSIRALPAAIQARARLSQTILSATVQADGTVEVWTTVEEMGGGKVRVETGRIYKLKKGRNGWQVSEKGAFWI